jgi:excisionase family DNA binding protein
MTYRNHDPARRHNGNALPKFYDIRSVANSLDVSDRTVRRWVAKGDLIVHRVDGVVRVGEADLRAFLALHREV